MSRNPFGYFVWDIRKPLHTLRYVEVESQVITKPTMTQLGLKMTTKPFETLDKMTPMERMLMFDSSGLTFSEFVVAVSFEFNRVVPRSSDMRQFIYGVIGQCASSEKRRRVIKRFEEGRLRVHHILGKHLTFCG